MRLLQIDLRGLYLYHLHHVTNSDPRISYCRHDSGGSIFLRRSDYSSFNVLPRSKINSYHIKMEDECSIGNDETRCFILSNYATNKMNRVPCVLCNCMMNIFERWSYSSLCFSLKSKLGIGCNWRLPRYPLIDGTFFLSPRQHTTSCIPVSFCTCTH